MREQLRGRNLAHIGCFLGLVLGLSGGIALAGILAAHNVAIGMVMLIWLGLAAVLGVVGFVVGNAVSDPTARAPRE